jgi:hypothetical protein
MITSTAATFFALEMICKQQKRVRNVLCKSNDADRSFYANTQKLAGRAKLSAHLGNYPWHRRRNGGAFGNYPRHGRWNRSAFDDVGFGVEIDDCEYWRYHQRGKS